MFFTKPVLPTRLTMRYTKWKYQPDHGSHRHVTANVLVKPCTRREISKVAAELVTSEPAGWGVTASAANVSDASWAPRSITSLLGPDEEAIDLMLSIPEYHLHGPDSAWTVTAPDDSDGSIDDV